MSFNYFSFIIPLKLCLAIGIICTLMAIIFRNKAFLHYWYGSWGLYIFFVMFWNIIGIPIIWANYSEPKIIEKSYELVSLVNRTTRESHGNADFLLILGQADYSSKEYLKIRYAYKTENGVKIEEKDLIDNKIFIEEIDNLLLATKVDIYSEKKNKIIKDDIIKTYLRTVFKIPKGSIINKYNLDLER